MPALILSRVSTRCAALTAFSTLSPASASRSTSLAPPSALMPPWLLISSIAMSAPIFLSWPCRAHRPDSGATSAIFTSSAAGAGRAISVAAVIRVSIAASVRRTASVRRRSDIAISFRGVRSGDGRTITSGLLPHRDWVQNADRVLDAQPLARPIRYRRPRVDREAVGLVAFTKRGDRIGRHRSRRWDFGDGLAIWAPEAQLTIALPLHAISLFVDCAMMSAAEHCQVGKRCRPTMRPVTNVMALCEPMRAAGEATGAITMLQRPPQCGWNRPGPCPDLGDAALGVVAHDDPARIARQSLRCLDRKSVV